MGASAKDILEQLRRAQPGAAGQEQAGGNQARAMLERLRGSTGKPRPSRGEAFLNSFAQGLTLNFGDELGAAAAMADERDAPLSQQSGVNPYDSTLAGIREHLHAGQKDYPGTSLAGGLSGGLALGYGAGAGGLSLLKNATSIPSAIGYGAAEGAAFGGISGVGAGETGTDRLKQGGIGAAFGSVLGAASGGVGGWLAQRGSRAAPTAEELETQSRAAYKAAEAAGVVVPSARLGKVAGEIEQAVATKGFDADLNPEIAAALKRLNSDAAKDLSLEQLEILRRVIKGAAASNNAHTRMLADVMIGKLDDFVENMRPEDVIGGESQAGQVLQQARALWSRAAKGGEIQELMDRAAVRAQGFSASGRENALRVEFRQLALNARRMRTFTPEEQAAIRKVAMGGALDNALRMLGKLAPTSVVSGGAGVGMGWLAAGPAGALAVPAVGGAARLGATGLTIRNANLASELVRRGGPAIAKGVAPGSGALVPGVLGAASAAPDSEQRRQQLIEWIMSGGGE